MCAKFVRDTGGNYSAWSLDQLMKSEFFHQKIHEWGLLDVAERIESVRGEELVWDLAKLGIITSAWDKVIHRGIKPVVVFAHPNVLQSVPRAVGYYRMLAMVSQKSMSNLRLHVTRFEDGSKLPDSQRAWAIAHRLNPIISTLIQSDEILNPREFDLWRGMAAGAQADGSWRNLKGKKAETAVAGVILRRLREKNLLRTEATDSFELLDGRKMVFADEPDIAIYHHGQIQLAVEVKGGIDTAGILERVGAAIKSLSRAREENPNAVTILLAPAVSMTKRAVADLLINQETVNHWFTIDEFLEDEAKREQIFDLMQI